jgi:hypothetical protein
VPSAVFLVIATVRLVIGGHREAHRLRQHDVAERAEEAESGRARGLPLAFRHRQDAGPEDLLGEGGKSTSDNTSHSTAKDGMLKPTFGRPK